MSLRDIGDGRRPVGRGGARLRPRRALHTRPYVVIEEAPHQQRMGCAGAPAEMAPRRPIPTARGM